ncbi:MAG TPA: hypothetical protein VK524_01340 [Polyangiaceae bacterium]|nr:hypothetical protein [Polyangiaceae bacterium]
MLDPLVVVVDVLAPALVAPVAPALVAPGFVVAAPASAALVVPVAAGADFVSVPGLVPASCACAGSAAVNPASNNTQQAL